MCFRQRLFDHQHVIDRQRAYVVAPGLGGIIRIGYHRLQSRIFEIGTADHAGVNLAVHEHLHNRLARRRTNGGRRIGIFSDMGVFESHPLNTVQIDTVIIL